MIKLGLELSLKVNFRIWIFRGNSKHFILNGSRRILSQFIMMFFLKLYQFFFLFFKTLIRWRNIGLEFSLKVIFRIWMFNSKHFILFYCCVKFGADFVVIDNFLKALITRCFYLREFF